MKRLLTVLTCALLPSLLAAQPFIVELGIPDFHNSNSNPKVFSANIDFKPPLVNNDHLRVVLGFAGVFSDAADKTGNIGVGLKYVGLPLNLSASGVLYIPSADNDNDASFSALVAFQDSKFGYFAPESTPAQLNFETWANLPYGLRTDLSVGGLFLFVNDKQVLSEDSFEFFVPYSARVSKNQDNLEIGAAFGGIWYATENVGDASQLKFDAGIWLGPFKPTIEATFPLSNELSDVLDKTFTLKLVVK